MLQRVISMMEKSQNYLGRQGFAQRCKVCGKEGRGNHIKDHIEANHLEGIIIPCNLCDKIYGIIRDNTKSKSLEKHSSILQNKYVISYFCQLPCL